MISKGDHSSLITMISFACFYSIWIATQSAVFGLHVKVDNHFLYKTLIEPMMNSVVENMDLLLKKGK